MCRYIDISYFFFYSRGAFHYGKDSGNFGGNSNGKVRLGFFRPEYSGSTLEVVHLFRLEYSDRDSPFHFWQTGSLPKLGNSEMIKSGKSYFYWLARFNRKMSFHFPWVVPLISDRSVWHNGKQRAYFILLTEAAGHKYRWESTYTWCRVQKSTLDYIAWSWHHCTTLSVDN